MFSNTLAYYIKKDNESYQFLKEYSFKDIGHDGILARQMCHYLVINGNQYKLLWNEQEENKQDVLTLEDQGKSVMFGDEMFNYREGEIIIEYRPYRENQRMPLIGHTRLSETSKDVPTHFQVLSLLAKDAVVVPGLGKRNVDSFELDEDRCLYVVYFEPNEEDIIKYGL